MHLRGAALLSAASLLVAPAECEDEGAVDRCLYVVSEATGKHGKLPRSQLDLRSGKCKRSWPESA
jgi:hypothetical protein